MLGTYDHNAINITFYLMGGNNSTFSQYTYWQGLQSNHILKITGNFNNSYRILNSYSVETRSTDTLYIPSELMHYNSPIIYDYFVGGKTLQQIEQQLVSANDKLDSVNDNLEDINDTLSNTTVDDSLITTITDSTQDITESGVSSVFTKFYDALTNYDSGTTGFTVDIMGASFDITSDMIYDLMVGNNIQWLIGIIHSFYWYWVCRYCVKDIYRYISKIKDGTIMTSSETNIKEEML